MLLNDWLKLAALITKTSQWNLKDHFSQKKKRQSNLFLKRVLVILTVADTTWFSRCGTNSSQHFPLLFIVHATEQLAFFQHKLITSLQPAFTLTAAEAAQVVHLAQDSHYQLRASNHLQAGAALPYKEPGGMQKHKRMFFYVYIRYVKKTEGWGNPR